MQAHLALGEAGLLTVPGPGWLGWVHQPSRFLPASASPVAAGRSRGRHTYAHVSTGPFVMPYFSTTGARSLSSQTELAAGARSLSRQPEPKSVVRSSHPDVHPYEYEGE